jgi:hypothetical protein
MSANDRTYADVALSRLFEVMPVLHDDARALVAELAENERLLSRQEAAVAARGWSIDDAGQPVSAYAPEFLATIDALLENHRTPDAERLLVMKLREHGLRIGRLLAVLRAHGRAPGT